MSVTLPTVTSYGSQVLTSGDLCARSMSGRDRNAVYTTDPANPRAKTAQLAYVADDADGTVTACSQVVSETSGGAGLVSIGVLEPATATVVKTFQSDALGATICSSGVSATLAQRGLSFDSDACAIFFGKDKTFRIMYTDDSPPRLVFQCLNAATGEYVTKFSCLKE